MKLSRKVLLTIAAGAFVIILVSLGLVLFQSLDEQSQLKEQLALSQSSLQGINLERLSAQQAELEEQLSQAASQFESVKGILSEPVGSIAVATSIFEIAETYSLVVTEITSPGQVDENLEGANLQVVSLTAEVQGNVSNLVNFTTDLNSFFTTGAVKSVTITVPEGSSADNASASVQLVVYTYRGD
ncbi:hypothetical protein ACFLVC_01545 [Chloroflexota bacterium]